MASSVFLCDGANMTIPAEIPARSQVVFDEKITNTGQVHSPLLST